MSEIRGRKLGHAGDLASSFASLQEIVPSPPAFSDHDPSEGDPAGWVPPGWELPLPMPKTSSVTTAGPKKSIKQRVRTLIMLRRSAAAHKVSPSRPGGSMRTHESSEDRGPDREKRQGQMGEMLVSVLKMVPHLDSDGRLSASAQLSHKLAQRMKTLDAFVLNPHGRIRMFWDLSTVAILLYLMASLPIFIGFDIPTDAGTDAIDWFITVFFLIDIFVNFRTGYVDDNGAVIPAAWPIAWRYLRGWFIIDVLSSVPFDRLAPSQGGVAVAVRGVPASPPTFRPAPFSTTSALCVRAGHIPWQAQVRSGCGLPRRRRRCG
jgi:hypothetical protein